MNTKCLILAVLTFAAVALSSCNTAAGRGAAIGAGTGALVGGPIGAAVGAASGALIGAAVQENRASEYGPAPAGGYPLARRSGRVGFYRSPYTGRQYDLRGVPTRSLVRDADTNQLFRKP